MQIIYFSPHLDDVALSCGGLVWQQVQEGHEVGIWTICAGDPPSHQLSGFAEELHQRWQVNEDAVAKRREEDILSCEILGASYLHLDLPDCIYRIDPDTQEALYTSEEAIFGDLLPVEDSLVNETAQRIKKSIDPNSLLVSPLTLGHHVDHQLCRQILEKINNPIQYYLDYPYVVNEPDQIGSLIPKEYQRKLFSISEPAISVWQESIQAHQSQISSFWKNSDEMKKEIQEYAEKFGGISMYITK